MNFQEVLAYLYSSLPMFHRVGPAAYNRSLDKTLSLLAHLGNPHANLKYIHIAGTNGKGSVSSMLSAILTQAGYKTGLYTSPHLIDFRERIRVNGSMIDETYVVDWIEQHKPFLDELQPSFFETTVGLCFDYFRHENIDIGVIETGLGGRIDSTNVITPLLSIITNISWDHADLLGDTLVKIAGEKAGIIKQGIPILSGTTEPEIIEVFREQSSAVSSHVLLASDCWKILKYQWDGGKAHWQFMATASQEILEIETDLPGEYQKENLPVVLTAVDYLREIGYDLSIQNIRSALSQVRILAGLRGRMEKLSDSPILIADTAHNEAGVKMVMHQLQNIAHENIKIVWGMVGDKDRGKILPLLPVHATYYFVKPNLPRGLEAKTLEAEASLYGLRGKAFSSVMEGVQTALHEAHSQDLVFVGGSTFVVGEFLGAYPESY